MRSCFGGTYEGLTVLLTGHTGFKGSWLALWLQQLGARVVGLGLEPSTNPSHFVASRVSEGIVHEIGDIRDFSTVHNLVQKYRPTIVFHLAAQPLVLESYQTPKETIDTNVGGTVNVLEAIRLCPDVRAAVMITSDKCYENKEWIWGYRENDLLGGADPYSASKCMAEHAVRTYRASFFTKEGTAAIASARAGNVIGGGDFSANRIVPDTMKALTERRVVTVRNPRSVRPWLHVLEPLNGYLSLGERLLNGGREFADAWNFGPQENYGIDVQTLVEKAIEFWGEGDWVQTGDAPLKPEMGLLRLNWDKAAHMLDWKALYSWDQAVGQTVEWFKAFAEFQRNPGDNSFKEFSIEQIAQYVQLLNQQKMAYTTV